MKEGLVTEIEIVRWRDADTPIVRISREFPVRLVDTDQNGQFDAPEKNTVKGKEALKYVNELLPPKSKCILFIPSKNSIKLTDITSFDRILGEILLKDGRKLTDDLSNNGFGDIK